MDTHIPVLLREVVETLSPKDGGIYIDATFGGGGYTRALLEAKNCKVIGIDRDPDAAIRAKSFKNEFKDRFEFISGVFSELDTLLPQNQTYDGIVFDFGVSSFQLDQAERGFSFRFDGPLDMRMSKDQGGPTAAEILNTYPENQLSEIIYVYGEEKKARIIAKTIVEQRKTKFLETTQEFAKLVRSIVKRHDGIDPATLTFQALRIFVNNELIEIDTSLKKTFNLLSVGGKVITVTFHSLEDRLVKNWMRTNAFACTRQGYALKTLFSKPLAPSLQEIKANPRSRSAKMRAATLVPLNEKGTPP
ncbi:MAG: 16S rRNA (cytosine(1402)-N(4))-methyltransferase RsmH [Alphaproteobacteria bacterium]|nr:16S rRNA (cytosine(1402)-N(4))-methyltransferase RsmH [Alphaproteobacteria bacterium]